ncbi:hypothetical protein SAMN05443529_10111 [Desulfosporosinus hippei DSM 8344]|uniref:Uncharacterized protein n=1 Tax=Desulfosporosinus hippei DSM 8344 TaxID=1121419 RepID=A0A1G7R988_9FIRM|nr:hypothetical protein SAMN05443529_10111 [Desulfosporosinus hippei DSM 8344]
MDRKTLNGVICLKKRYKTFCLGRSIRVLLQNMKPRTTNIERRVRGVNDVAQGLETKQREFH